MLPRFMKVENVLQQIFRKLLFEITHTGDPVFGKVDATLIQEGRATYQKHGTSLDKFPLQEFSGYTQTPIHEFKSFGAREFFEQAKKMGGDFLKQKSRHFFSVLNEATERSGNIIDGKGQPFGHDFLLKGIGQIPIDFDESGNPILPTVVISPQLRPRVEQLIAEQDDPEVKKKFDDLIERKREEYRAREADRRLDG